jgi:hypothetical protein
MAKPWEKYQKQGSGPKGPWDKYAKSQGGTEVKKPAEWSDLPSNILPSMKNAALGVAHVTTHLGDTAKMVDAAATGGLQNLMAATGLQKLDDAITPDWFRVLSPHAAATAQDVQIADAVGGMLKDRYGGLENLKNTVITDPFGSLMDISALATAGGTLATKLPMAGNVAKTLKTVGEFTNPVNAIVKPITRYTPLGNAAIDGQTRASTALLRNALPKDLSKFKGMGDEAMLLDASPSTVGLAQGVALSPGSAKDALVEALLKRDKGRSARLLADKDKTLGPARDPEAFKKLIGKEAGADASPHYKAAKQNPPDLRGDVDLENMLAQELTDPAKGMSLGQRARNLKHFNDIEDALKADTPQETVKRLHSIRRDLDLAIYDNMNLPAQERAVAKNVRDVIDKVLKERVPGFKEGDKIYSDGQKAIEGVDYGYNSLDGGKGAAFPETFNEELKRLPREFVAEGQNARIANAMGTQANDLAAIRKMIGGDFDFNRAKLGSTFGDSKVQNLVNSVDREGAFAQNFADVARNSQAAQRQTALEQIKSSEPFKISDSASFTGLGGKAIAKTAHMIIGKVAGKVSANTTDALAAALQAKGANAQKIIDALMESKKVPANDKAILAALIGGRNGEAARASQR